MSSQKENTRICCMCGSSPSKDLSISLHRFPKPGSKNALRCELWAKYCFPNEAWSSPKFQNGLHSRHKMLCSKHFKRTCFIENKLFRTAVPGGQCHEVDDTDICDDDDDDSDTLVESNVCRVCLALDVKMYDLKDIELREMFQNITGIVVLENNHSMLERLCWECAGRLKAAAAFRNKALLSDALLQGLANTGEQIRKNDVTLIKENQDYLKSAGTLSIAEVFHTVDIDAEYESAPSISENNDRYIVQNTVRKDSIELKQSIIKENNDQMVVEDEPMIRAPIKTVIEYDPLRPDTGEIKWNIVLETNPPFSSNIPRENTSNSAYISPPPGCSRVETKAPTIVYLLKTPSDSENKVKKTVAKITKRDSISKIVSKKSKEVINHDQKFKRAAKLKNTNLKVYDNSKKTLLNQKLVKKTQVMTNTSTDEEYTDEEYLNFENYEF